MDTKLDAVQERVVNTHAKLCTLRLVKEFGDEFARDAAYMALDMMPLIEREMQWLVEKILCLQAKADEREGK